MNHSSERSPAGSRARWSLVGVTAALVVVGVAALRPRPDAATAARPASPAPAQLQLLHAERFHVDQPFRHTWRADRAAYQDGWLLVLAGDPELLRPRQVRQPVLFVGAQVANRVNSGGGSGKLVVIVPGDFRLEDAPIFFGGDTLPEELQQSAIDAELANARAAGVQAPGAAAIGAAFRDGVRTFPDDYRLRLRAIELVAHHAPDEQDLIRTADVPLLK